MKSTDRALEFGEKVNWEHVTTQYGRDEIHIHNGLVKGIFVRVLKENDTTELIPIKDIKRGWKQEGK